MTATFSDLLSTIKMVYVLFANHTGVLLVAQLDSVLCVIKSKDFH